MTSDKHPEQAIRAAGLSAVWSYRSPRLQLSFELGLLLAGFSGSVIESIVDFLSTRLGRLLSLLGDIVSFDLVGSLLGYKDEQTHS